MSTRQRAAHWAPGDVIARCFEVLAPLGEGGAGVVLHVRDRRNGEERALKVLEDARRSEVPREVRLLVEIDHPHIARLHDFVRTPAPAFTMDLIHGADLADLEGQLSEATCASVARQCLETLAFLHGRGLLHRDLKPSNVRLTADGHAVLLDLGLAAFVAEGAALAGTPAMLAPEVRGGAPQSAASDLYALGLTLRHAASPSARVALASLLEALTAQDPAARPASARAALEQLERGVQEVLPGPRIVGRDAELGRIDAWLDALGADEDETTRSTVPRMVLIQGPPGSGRGRLLRALHHRAQLRGIASVDLRRPVASAVGDSPTPDGVDLTPGTVAAQRARAAAEAVDHATRWDRVVLLDADDADGLASDVLRLLLARKDNILIGVRTTDVNASAIRSRLDHDSADVAIVRAGPLPESACAALLRDALALPDDARGTSTVAAAIRRRASGLPGPFLHAVQALVAADGMTVAGDRAVLVVETDAIPAPDRAHAALHAGLPRPAARAATLLELFGADLGPRTRDHLDIDPPIVQLLLRRGAATLRWREGAAFLCAATPRFGSTDDAAFHSALARAADECADEVGPRATELATWHALAANPSAETVRRARDVAASCLANSDIAGSRRLLLAAAHAPHSPAADDAARDLSRIEACLGNAEAARSALTILDEAATASPGARARAAVARGEVERLLGAIPDAAAALDRAVDSGALRGDDRAEALRIRAVCRLQLGHTDDAIADADAAAERARSDYERATCLGTRAQVLHRAGRGAEALEALDGALGVVNERKSGFGMLPPGLRQLRGLIRSAAGDLDPARDDLERAAAAFRDAGHLVNLATTLNNLGLLLEKLHANQDALAAHEEALEIRRRAGEEVGVAASLVNRGSLLVRLGRLTEARTDLEDGLREFTALDHPRGRTAALIALADSDRRLAVSEPARRRAADAVAIAETHEFAAERLAARKALGAAWLLAPADPDEALAVLEGTPDPDASTLALIARSLAIAGRPEHAATAARSALDAARQPDEVLDASIAAHAAGIVDPIATHRLREAQPHISAPDDRLNALLLLSETGQPDRERIARELEQVLRPLEPEEATTMFEARWEDRIESVLDRLRAGDGGGDGATDNLMRMGRLVSSERAPEQLLDEILDAAIDMTGAAHGFIVLRDEDDFSLSVARRAGGKSLRVPKRLISSTIIHDVLANGHPITTGNATGDHRFGGMLSVNNLKLKSVACIPFTADGRVRGAMYLDHPGREDAFPMRMIRVLSAFADQAAIVFQRSERETRIRQLNGQLQELLRQERQRAHAVTTELQAARGPDADGTVIAESPGMRDVMEMVHRVARADIPVLVVGETGSGKDLIAREIHSRSRRCDGPFLGENCAAIPDGLLEAELFGSMRGAFTGAVEDRPGLMQLAESGTLFLDEIGDMRTELQGKLLRALEEGSVRAVGASRARPCNFRLVTATNRPLDELREGVRFRTDLFYRIGAAIIEIPPLRERPEDAAAFIDRYLAARGDLHLEPPTRRRLLEYDWPGNFRELQNEMARLVALNDGPAIPETLLSDRIRRFDVPADDEIPFALDALRGWALSRAMATTDGDKIEAARLLGVSRSTLYQELKRHSLSGYLRNYHRRPEVSPKEGPRAV